MYRNDKTNKKFLKQEQIMFYLETKPAVLDCSVVNERKLDSPNVDHNEFDLHFQIIIVLYTIFFRSLKTVVTT